MILRLLHSRQLLAAFLAAITGMALFFRAPFPETNLFLRILAMRSAAAFLFLKYSYTVFLYTTPYVGLSIFFSGLYIVVLKRRARIHAGKLPPYPDPRQREELSLVIGEVHHPRKQVTTAEKAGSPEFQAWLRHKNANGSDIHLGMNPLKPDAATRTKEDIDAIRHVYIDLDYGGARALEAVHKSAAVPKPNFVLTSSPDKFQVIWKVHGMTLDEAEALLHALAREFGGDPAATDATRVLRLPGFANKKYRTDFYVEAERHSTETYSLRDFKLHIDGQDSPRQNHHTSFKRESRDQH